MRVLLLLIALLVFASPASADLRDDIKEAKAVARRLERQQPAGYEALLDETAKGLAELVRIEIRAAAIALSVTEDPGRKPEKTIARATARLDRSSGGVSRRKRLKLLQKALRSVRRAFRVLRKRSPDETQALRSPVATIADHRIDESSGLAWWHGAFWTLNDSGGAAELYRSETPDFSDVTAFPIPGATNVDWEDLAVHEGDLIVADIGDNDRLRDDLVLYRVRFDGKALTLVAAYDVAYPDAAHDAEAVASIDGSLHVITKDRGEGTLAYRFDGLHAGATNTPVFVGELDLGGDQATAAEFDEVRGELLVLSYFGVHHFAPLDLAAGPKRTTPLFALQVEGLTIAGDLLVITNEQEQVYAALLR